MQAAPEFPDETACNTGVVKVAFPADVTDRGPYKTILGRGNLPLLIGDCLLAEVTIGQLEDEWKASGQVSQAQTADYCRRAANRLVRAFEAEIAAAELSDIVANAAVLFVLSLKRAGIEAPSQIKPCTVSYDGSQETGHVSLAG